MNYEAEAGVSSRLMGQHNETSESQNWFGRRVYQEAVGHLSAVTGQVDDDEEVRQDIEVMRLKEPYM